MLWLLFSSILFHTVLAHDVDRYHDFVKALVPKSVMEPQTFSIGYGSCEDVNILATDLVPKIIAKYGLQDVTPKHRAALSDIGSVVESFLFSFQHGSNAELKVDPVVFRDIQELIKTIPHKVFPGGNALCIAHRIAKEEPRHVVKLGAHLSPAFQKKLGRRGIRQIIEPTIQSELMDVHLAIEYKTDDVIAGVRAPRMNRFYMNADKHNAELTGAMALHKEMKPTDFFVISGLQLLRSANEPGLDAVSQALKAHSGGSHFESGSYEDKSLFEGLWTKGLFRYTRSLGMNEQELALLDHVLKTGDPSSAPQATESSPDADWALDTVGRVLRGMRNLTEKAQLSRIHMHALGFQVLCFDPERWGDGRDAVAAASRVASELACGDALKEHSWESFRPLGELHLEKLPGTGLRCGYVDGIPDLKCCVTPVLVCKVPVRTAGIGDNISGAGLAHQVYRGEPKASKTEL